MLGRPVALHGIIPEPRGVASHSFGSLQLGRFWSEKLPPGRESVARPQVLELLAVNRLIEPGSEFGVHRRWFDQSTMDVLLG